MNPAELLQNKWFIVAVAFLVVAGGAVFAALKFALNRRVLEGVKLWGTGAYSIWSGGEDSGTWPRQRAASSLSSWYGAEDSAGLERVVAGLKQGQTGNMAWDLVRAIDLLRIGYAAGYLSEEDCWQKIAKIGIILQQNFPSWEALAQAFEAGMNAWQRQRGITDPNELGRVQRNLGVLRSQIWPKIAYGRSLVLPED
jgi:hypothetical protein